MPPTVPKSVRAWVADAEATYGQSFAAWFLPDFDWEALCADAPAFAARLGESWSSPTAAAGRARLEETAADAFRGAHVAALALLAAYDATMAPDDALLRLCGAPDDDEREALSDVADDLEAVERRLLSESDEGGEDRVSRAVTATRAIRGPVRELLADGLARAATGIVGLGVAASALSRVLAGVVSVAVALAALRHAVASDVDADAGREALAFDVVALRSALGPTT